jgi:hypothetical protein
MNYGTAGMLPVTGIGIAVAGHNLALGVTITAAAVMVAVGCVLYRFGSRARRIDAAK